MRFATSVCPSDCGWYDELKRSFVPFIVKSSRQNLLINNGSLSDTMLLGMPWRHPKISMNNRATVCAVCWVGNIPKCKPFEKRSTMTKMHVLPRYEGSPVIKSMDRSSHGSVGIGRGQRSPPGLQLSYLVCWHVAQAVTNLRVSSLIEAQVKLS